MTRRLATNICALVFLLAPQAASGDIINVSGSWTYVINGAGFSNQAFSGSATFQYDDSVLTGTPGEFIDNITLISFSQSPSVIGSTTFDTTNTRARVVFNGDGSVNNTQVGGLPLGVPNIDINQDDFRVTGRPLGSAQSPLASISIGTGISGFANGSSVTATFTHSSVPEPSGLVLLAIGALGVSLHRRNRSH